MISNYLESCKKQFEYNKDLAEKTFDQLSEEQLFWQPNNESNSVAIIAKHIAGNMLSRWTNFLTEDGEKNWRDRDTEFENSFITKKELQEFWEKGWQCLFNGLNTIDKSNSDTIVYIRNHGHTIPEAINRQLCHYSYHVGQIVFMGKMIQNANWSNLSVPRNQSKAYNQEKFAKTKTRKHFTEDL